MTGAFLADCVWPDKLPARPSEQLSVLVSRLRSALGPDVIVRTEAGYSLAVEWLDLDAMALLVEDARRRMEEGNTTAAAVAATAALNLARGPLLPDEPDAPWAEADRAMDARLEATARRLRAEAAFRRGDFVGAALMAQGALDHDDFDKPALRTLMAALARSGRPATALAAYAEVRERLAEELGVDPTPETEALHTAILLGEAMPGPDGSDGRPEAPAATEVAWAPTGRPPRRSGPALLGLDAPPGRADAMAALDDTLAGATAGRGSLVMVTGEAGMGKSHLLEAWTDRAGDAATVLTGRCEESSRGVPLQAIFYALETHLRALDPGATAALLGTESEILRPFLVPFGRATPVPVSGLRDWGGGGQLVDFGALLAVLTCLPAPTVLVLDVVHLAGPATIAWLDYAGRRAGSLELLIVASQRPDEAVELPAAKVIELTALAEADSAELVGSGRAEALVARSGGNPLFLVELAAAPSDESLPASIKDAVTARCARAGPDAVVTLRTAAVIGPEVDLDLLAAVLRSSPVELLDHLEEGGRRGILVERAGRFVFRHELVRDALVVSTSATRQAFAHREAGRVLAARPTRDAYTVAHHARLGGDDELAASALLEAAEGAFVALRPGGGSRSRRHGYRTRAIRACPRSSGQGADHARRLHRCGRGRRECGRARRESGRSRATGLVDALPA